MKQWYKKALWRNLVDMHIPDWNDAFMSKFDPAEYVRLMGLAKVEASEVYAGNCLGICFWPTKEGHMHRGLKGADIVGPVVAGNREKGIHPVVYYNIWSRWAHDNYPDWRMVTADGRSTIDNGDDTFGRYGVCCMNASGFREYTKKQLEDLCGRYDMDGLWVDMIGWNGTVCHCAHCRRRFFDETGREIPRKVDWFDPVWVLFQRKREEWYADFARLVRSSALAARPGISVTLQCASWQGGWVGGVNTDFLRESDYLAGDFYNDSLAYSVICKFMNNATGNRPIEFMTSRCVSLYDHTSIKSTQELRASVCAATAHNAAFTFIDAIDPDGMMNPVLYEKMGALHQELGIYLDEVSIDAEIVRDVSVYMNFESFIDLKANGTPTTETSRGVFSDDGETSVQRMKNIGKSLISAHIPYDIVAPEALDKAIKDSRLIILPGVYMMDEREISALKSFVENGGSLIVTERTSIMDKNGVQNGDFLLSGLTGVHYRGMTAEDVTYFSPAVAGALLFPEYSEKYPLAIDDHSVITQADGDVEILATVTLPYSHSGEIYNFGSAISNPPGRKTDYPAVTVRRAGMGRVMYIASALEKEADSAQREIFIKLIKFMLDKPQRVELDAPSWLESVLYDDVSRGRYVLYLLTAMPVQLDVLARDVNVRARADKAVTRVKDIGSGADIPFDTIDGYITFHIPQVDTFSMIILDYGQSL